MANQISVTRNAGAQHHAAKALSSALNELQINHVVIGGFALHLLGSPRHTDDVDMMIDVVPNKMHDFLRPRLKYINQHFAELGLKFYHVPKLVEGLAEKELVLINEGNVLIETLPTNTLGLPSEIDPAMILYLGEEEGSSEKGLPTLHPSVLVLTKLKRWANISTSTYPPSIRKARTDFGDILFLLEWQAARNLTISIQAYKAQQPDRLYQALNTLAVYIKDNEMVEPWALLKKVVTAEDWQQMGWAEEASTSGSGATADESLE